MAEQEEKHYLTSAMIGRLLAEPTAMPDEMLGISPAQSEAMAQFQQEMREQQARLVESVRSLSGGVSMAKVAAEIGAFPNPLADLAIQLGQQYAPFAEMAAHVADTLAFGDSARELAERASSSLGLSAGALSTIGAPTWAGLLSPTIQTLPESEWSKILRSGPAQPAPQRPPAPAPAIVRREPEDKRKAALLQEMLAELKAGNLTKSEIFALLLAEREPAPGPGPRRALSDDEILALGYRYLARGEKPAWRFAQDHNIGRSSLFRYLERFEHLTGTNLGLSRGKKGLQ